MARKTEVTTAEERTEVATAGENTSKKDKIPEVVLACIGKKFIINTATNRVSMIGNEIFNVAYENAVMTHGIKNIRPFACNKDNVAELNVILKKYQNNILKN